MNSITERRVVVQEWYETGLTKTGWDSHGWVFKDTRSTINIGWVIEKILKYDENNNPIIGIAEKITEIN